MINSYASDTKYSKELNIFADSIGNL